MMWTGIYQRGRGRLQNIVIVLLILIVLYFKVLRTTRRKENVVLVLVLYYCYILLWQAIFTNKIKMTFDLNFDLYQAFKQHGYTKTWKHREAVN